MHEIYDDNEKLNEKESQMPYYEEEPVPERRVVREPTGERESLTGYAFVKYAFILAITIVVLYFIANYIIPRF